MLKDATVTSRVRLVFYLTFYSRLDFGLLDISRVLNLPFRLDTLSRQQRLL